MSSPDHDELRSLLGAFVLNAVSRLEERAVTLHLDTCEDCAREARLLGAAATELSLLTPTTEMDTDFVDRIVAAVPRRQGLWVPVRFAAAAAAILIAATGAIGTVAFRDRADARRISRVVAIADRSVPLKGSGTFAGKGAVSVAAGQIAVVLEDMPDLEKGHVWQLWALQGATPKSIATFTGTGHVGVVAAWRDRADGFAITPEPEGGSKQPTTTPVLKGV